jgi:hypothetical protein
MPNPKSEPQGGQWMEEAAQVEAIARQQVHTWSRYFRRPSFNDEPPGGVDVIYYMPGPIIPPVSALEQVFRDRVTGVGGF